MYINILYVLWKYYAYVVLKKKNNVRETAFARTGFRLEKTIQLYTRIRTTTTTSLSSRPILLNLKK